MKKILVTGAGGFIGSHLTEELVKAGFDVKVLLRYNSLNNWGWLEDSECKNSIEIITGDIRDYDSVSSAMKGCDTVYHLAALIGIPYSYVSPLAYMKTNAEGTYNVLESARKYETGNVVITSTSETYGTAQYVPIDENHAANAQSPYAASKVSADSLAISYFRSFNLPVKIVRPFNTYGPRQSARAFIPTVITQILSGSKSIKSGNLHPTRDLTYVKDTVKGFVEIGSNDIFNGQATNIGMNEEISMIDLANRIADIINVKLVIEESKERTRPNLSEVERLWCNNTKLISNSNWKPDYTLKSGLEKTIDWFRKNHSDYKAEIYNV